MYGHVIDKALLESYYSKDFFKKMNKRNVKIHELELKNK